MPDYRYRPKHHPPRRSDRLDARPGEHFASAFSIIVGAVLLASTTGTTPFIGIDRLGLPVYITLGILLIGGGGAALIGIQWPRESISVGWVIERVGCIVCASGWAAATVVLTQVRPLMFFGLLVCGFLSMFYVFRFRLLNRVELQAREDTGKEAL